MRAGIVEMTITIITRVYEDERKKFNNQMGRVISIAAGNLFKYKDVS